MHQSPSEAGFQGVSRRKPGSYGCLHKAADLSRRFAGFSWTLNGPTERQRQNPGSEVEILQTPSM